MSGECDKCNEHCLECTCSPLKYRFEILYQTPNLRQVSNFMGNLDLGIDTLCFKDVITFHYTKEEKPVSYFKELIRKALESIGHTLIKIEGGKIE